MIECDFGEIVNLLEYLSFICYNPSNIGGLRHIGWRSDILSIQNQVTVTSATEDRL